MSNSGYYQKNKQENNKHNLIKNFLLSFLFFIMGASISSGIYWYINKRNMQAHNTKIEKLIGRLRSIEINKGATLYTLCANDTITTNSMMPGWVVHVYDKSKVENEAINDIGIFILDERRFPLNMHKFHNLKASRDPIYRMNSFYNAKIQGNHQLIISFTYPPAEKSTTFQKQALASVAKCRVILDLEDRKIIDKQFSITRKNSSDVHVTGTIELDKGLHSMELRISCEDRSSMGGDIIPTEPTEHIIVGIKTRSPLDTYPVTRRDTFWYRFLPRKQ